MDTGINCGSVTYKLVDFYAIETFDDSKYNTNPHVPGSPNWNGHNKQSAKSIDASLQGSSAKQALDFLAQHSGTFKKKHSVVHAVCARYLEEKYDATVISVPVSTEVQFNEYVRLGKPEFLTLRITAETA